MIRLTRLNGSEVFLNADLVATVESHHDTVVTLVDGKTYVVHETAEEVVSRITTYRAAVLAAVDMHIAGQALILAAKLAGPLLLVALIVGVVVSLVQAVFQVQDQTLSMVPKLAIGALVLALTGGWMLRITVEFTQQLFEQIPRLVG